PLSTVSWYFLGISSACTGGVGCTNHAAVRMIKPIAETARILVFTTTFLCDARRASQLISENRRLQHRRMTILVELEHGTPQRRRIERADAEARAGGPTAVLVLVLLQMVEHGGAIVVPGRVWISCRIMRFSLGQKVMSQIIAAQFHGVANG